MKFSRSFFQSPLRQSGFTLIVVIILLSVIGAIISYRIVDLRQKEREFKVEKAALQMKNIAEAAYAYRRDNGSWPDSEHLDNFKPYLPFAEMWPKNPWSEANRSYFVYYEARQFITQMLRCVITSVPSQDIANAIVALLPNGNYSKKTDGSGWFEVTIYLMDDIVPPSDRLGKGEIIIKKIELSPQLNDRYGFDDYGHYKYNTPSGTGFTCPENYIGKLMVVPYYFQTGKRMYETKTPTIKQIGLAQSPICSLKNFEYECSYQFNFTAQNCYEFPGPRECEAGRNDPSVGYPYYNDYLPKKVREPFTSLVGYDPENKVPLIGLKEPLFGYTPESSWSGPGDYNSKFGPVMFLSYGYVELLTISYCQPQ